MSQPEDNRLPSEEAPVPQNANPNSSGAAPPGRQRQTARRETLRWWIKLSVQPLLFLLFGFLLIFGLGLAQRLGLLSSGGASRHSQVLGESPNVLYICPMMCTPPRPEPGRCPVCGMELVPTTSGGGPADSQAVHIDPAARRIANIQTVAVTSARGLQTIRTVGELRYDEGTLKTIAAYAAGRLDRLYADYTGVVVQQGDGLALLYSPTLYSAQVELLLAKKARERSPPATGSRVLAGGVDMVASARERLILLGMTETQIAQLEQAGEASSRQHVSAPISGTVIEKLAVEGQYVEEGQAIYRLADLSTVWLMLRLFPDEAAQIRYGQKVEAEVQSLPGQRFAGRVAFIDPTVDSKTRTVGVRVVVPNPGGLLRVGDYATASLDVPLSGSQQALAYDPELADKWISPRHPHIIAAAAGDCPICGVPLVPAAEFGFSPAPIEGGEVLLVPRDAVLMAGNNSVVYVETEPGRFQLRRVVLGPSSGDQIVIRSGVKAGEQVATAGNFLIDSQMQLTGNPSLIDPLKSQELSPELVLSPEPAVSPELVAALASLSAEDRALVDKQQVCPVAGARLGSMGTPKKVHVQGVPVFICCEGCRQRLLKEPEKYLAQLAADQADPAETSQAGDKTPPAGLPLPAPPEPAEEVLR